MNIVASGFELIEGPVWHPEQGLLFADAGGKGGAYRLDRRGEVTTVFEHRRGIGGMARHANGGLVVSGRNIAYKGPAARGTVVLIEKEPAKGIVGFNDLTTDAAGRIYAGALGFLPTETELSGIGGEMKGAPLFLIGLDGSVRQVCHDVKLTNGMGFSPDSSLLYHADSGEHTVYVHHVAADGSLHGRRAFATVPEGLPDGLATAADGSVWVAVAHAGQIQVFEPDGTLRQRIAFPLPMVTSLCFGGDDLTEIYVMSGSDGTGRKDAGTVFHLHSDVAGLAVEPARVALPGEGTASTP